MIYLNNHVTVLRPRNTHSRGTYYSHRLLLSSSRTHLFSSNDGRTTTLDSCHYRHALSPSVQCTTSVKVFSHLRFPLFKPDLRLLALTSCIIPPSSMHIFPDSSPDSPLTSVSSSSSSRKRQNSSCLSNNLSQRREMGYIKHSKQHRICRPRKCYTLESEACRVLEDSARA